LQYGGTEQSAKTAPCDVDDDDDDDDDAIVSRSDNTMRSAASSIKHNEGYEISTPRVK